MEFLLQLLENELAKGAMPMLCEGRVDYIPPKVVVFQGL